METLGIEATVSIVLTVLTLIVTFIGHYFYVRGKLHKAAAGAISNAEQDDKTGEEKLELAVDQVYSLVPDSLKIIIHRKTVRKIVQAAFDKIEDYAKKQVEKKSKKKDDTDSAEEKRETERDNLGEIMVPSQSNEFSDSGGETEQLRDNSNAQSSEETEQRALNEPIGSKVFARTKIATTINNDTAQDEQSVNQVKLSVECSTHNNSISRSTIMENNQTNNAIDNEPVTCYEDVSARTEYSKQFNNPKTGVHTAVLFSSPIHSADGAEMATATNDFIDAVNDDGEEVYENRRNKFLVRLAKSTAQNKLVELVQGDHRIAMSPVASITSKISRFVSTIRRDIQAMCNLRRSPFAAKSNSEELSYGGARFAVNSEQSADVRFSNIIPNCDLEYLVENNRLKENIIVNSKCEAYEYMFNLNLKMLDARQNGKIIELYDKETGEVKYIIPAPYMYDMNGATSEGVQYLLEGSDGNYTLRVVADDEWINNSERQFPVVIDPQIMANTESIVSLLNGMRNSSSYTAPTGDIITIGNNRYNNQDHDYAAKIVLHGSAIQKQLGSDLRVTHAILELTRTGDSRASNTKGFEVSTDGTSATAIDRFVYNGINNRIEIDITAQVQEIINSGVDKNLFIKRINSDSVTDYIFIATQLNGESEHKPRIFVDYVSSRLNTDDMPYATASAGNGGSGKVNLSTGNLWWEIPEMQVKSNGIALSISHVYDGYLADRDQDYINSAINAMPRTPHLCCGKGFKLNIQQFLLKKTYDDDISLLGTHNYIYIDGSGNHHDFVEKYFYIDENDCKCFVERLDCSEDENGNLKYNDMPVEHIIENELGMELETHRDLLEYTLENKAYEVKYYRISNGYKEEVSAERAGESGVIAVRSYNDGIKICSDKLDLTEVEEARVAMDECELKLEEIGYQISSGVSQDYLTILESKQRRYKSELVEKTAKYNNAVSNQKRSPVDFITIGDGQVLGFDYYGRLVMIGNGSESGSAFIIYNNDDRIERVVDKDNIPLVVCGYKDGTLEYMTDKNGKTLLYAYSNNSQLKSIRYGNNVLCEIEYNASNRLKCVATKVNDSVLNGVSIEYINGQVTSLKEYSDIEAISNDGPSGKKTLYAKNLSVEYKDRYMSILMNHKTGIKTTYILDNIGRIITAYEGDDANAKSVSIEYCERQSAFSCNDLFSENKVISENNATISVSTAQQFSVANSDIDTLIPKSGMLLLSAWGKAKSFNLIHTRRLTAYGDDMFGHYELDANNENDFQRTNRRFGIFATVFYNDGTTSQEYSSSFDYYNTQRQLAILPIFVDRTDKKKVSKIIYGVDYSHNNGVAIFDNIKLTTCKGGTYREFNDDKLLIKETTDDGITEYEYLGEKPIKTTFTRFRDGKTFVSLCDYDTMGREKYSRDFDGNCKETFYDESGVVSKTEEYNEMDSTTKRVVEYRYDSDGNIVYESDNRGESGGQELWNINHIDNGITTRTRNAAGAVTAYGYNHYMGESAGISGDADGDPNTANFIYTYGYMTKVSHNGFDIDYTYDGLGHITKLDIAGSNIVTSIYSEDDGCLQVSSTYANGLRLITNTNRKDQVINIIDEETNQKIVSNEYDERDRIKVIYDNTANIKHVYEYKDLIKLNKVTIRSYDLSRMTVSINDIYDNENCVKETQVSFNEILHGDLEIDGNPTGDVELVEWPENTYVTKYEYEERYTKRMVKSIELNNNMRILPEYDALERYSGMKVKNNNKEDVYSENRYYVKHGDKTCDLIASERFGINGTIDEHIKYSYDYAGNISAITVNGDIQAKYSYDSLNRLVREENKAFGEVTEYTYDTAGNILKKTCFDTSGTKKTHEYI